MAQRGRRSFETYFSHLGTKIRKKLGFEPAESELDPELAARPLHFHAPPFTPELVAAIKLISPQFRLRATDHSRSFWERNQNGLCWGEYETLEPWLKGLGTPKKVLDIGPGMGRSTVFFKNLLGWREVPFHLYESSGEGTKYTKAGPRFDDSFCGSLDVLQEVLKHNEVPAVEVFDAADLEAKLSRLPGPYDLIYSFYAVGFHWSIEHFLDEILGLMHEGSIGAFTLHDRFKGSPKLEQVPHRIVQHKKSWPRDRYSTLVVLSPSEETLSRVD